MANENAHPLDSRIPLPADLGMICRELNARGVKYLDDDGVRHFLPGGRAGD